MASLLIRNLEDDVKHKLRQRAARNGRSMESEAREILTGAVAAPPPEKGLGTRIQELFADVDPETLAEWRRNLELIRSWGNGDPRAATEVFGRESAKGDE